MALTEEIFQTIFFKTKESKIFIKKKKFFSRECEWSLIWLILLLFESKKEKALKTTEGEKQQSMHHNFNYWNCRNNFKRKGICFVVHANKKLKRDSIIKQKLLDLVSSRKLGKTLVEKFSLQKPRISRNPFDSRRKFLSFSCVCQLIILNWN